LRREMKMLKKILFTIAVVAFLTASTQAQNPGEGTKFDGMWPYEYIYVPVCSVPIFMDVGYFVQLKDCGDYKIKLKQVACDSVNDDVAFGKDTLKDFPCYLDCEEIKVRANFNAKLSGKVVDEVDWFKDGDTSVYYLAAPGLVPNVILGDGAWHTRKVCVKAWDIKIWEAGTQDDEKRVATLWITVKPDQLYESWDGIWQGGGPLGQ